jgi:hypothetical protein
VEIFAGLSMAPSVTAAQRPFSIFRSMNPGSWYQSLQFKNRESFHADYHENDRKKHCDSLRGVGSPRRGLYEPEANKLLRFQYLKLKRRRI